MRLQLTLKGRGIKIVPNINRIARALSKQLKRERYASRK